ncbi:MAG: transcriptional regulator NrdR [Filifactoraceae bacterium]
MNCPYCNYSESKVIDSRKTDDGNAIRRRRECEECKKRFTTYEKIEQINLIVVKKDGAREYFDREKILKGIMRSCSNRPISLEVMEGIVNDIEKDLLNTLNREVSSVTIGEMVMDRLRHLDEVSYVRFASVYRKFKDLDSFMDELKKLMKDK